MGNVHMEASQINYRGGETKMSVEEALKNTSGEAAAIAQLQEDVSDLRDVTEDIGDAVKLNTQDLTTTSRTKNILPITVAGVKAANTTGTWIDNAYTMNGVTFTLGIDTAGNITSVTAAGTATDDAILYAGECTISAPVIASGSPASGSDETYYTVCNVGGWYAENREYGSGKTFNSGTVTNAALVVSDGYEIPEGGIVFYPMIRIATETSAAFAPYIPSMNGRVSALENAEPATWDYSTSEVNTGQKWIDGNDIFCKVYGNIQLTNNTDVTIDASFGADKNVLFIAGTGKYVSGNDTQYISFGNYLTGNDMVVPKVVNGALIAKIKDNWSEWTCHFIVFYTKTIV